MSSINDGYDETSTTVLECGDKPFLFAARRKTTGEPVQVPIGSRRYREDTHLYDFRPTLWCPEHGWVHVDDDVFGALDVRYGGIG